MHRSRTAVHRSRFVRHRLPVAILVTLALLALAGCTPVAPGIATATPSPALRPVQLGVGFIPNVQFAPFYVGMQKGFYAAEGIDLSLEYGFENDYLKLVGVDKLQFMVGSSDQVVLGRAQGLPVRYVMNWYTRYPVVVFAPAGSGIATPGDLAGHKVGVPGPFGATYIALRALLDAAGLDERDIQMESIGFTQASAVSEGLVDAAVDYAVNGPVVLAAAGIQTVQIPLDDYIKIPANGLVTNEHTIQTEPELVRGMVRATLRSIAYTLDHPDEAFEMALKYVPEAGGENRAANRDVFDASLSYWAFPTDRRPGATAEEEWRNAVDLLVRIGFIDRAPSVEDLYTNEFLGAE